MSGQDGREIPLGKGIQRCRGAAQEEAALATIEFP
jgi:hypothetical protein